MSEELNKIVANRLREAADLLVRQGANPFRANAYNKAADTIAGLDKEVKAIVEQHGPDALARLPGIGRGIAAAIYEIVATGRWTQLERLRGDLDPVATFTRIPGVGPQLARRIHDVLHVDSLEALETAAHDGRLAAVPGIGPRRIAALQAGLAALLQRRRRRLRAEPATAPDVATLLDVDAQYRREAEAGRLPTIAPKRFNPENNSWLPVLHTQRATWHFTVLYSNTALAHQLGRVHDWIVVYFYDPHHEEGQVTVVTETRGTLAGKRVVRGRERECLGYYQDPREMSH